MKLAEHVDHIRALIYGAFNNQFSRLGVGPAKMMDADRLPTHLQSKREKIEVLIKNHTDETGSYERAREKALDELTFTLFNRLAAIKVMEAHQLFPPVVTKEAEHGDRSFGHKVWLQQNPAMRNEELEGIRTYLKYEFNQLGESIPLYHKDYPYALLPFVIELNEIVDAFNEVAKDKQVEDNIWQSDDILGWLYESYNNIKKQAHKDSGEKTEYHKVSLQSQVYTPRWVVEFLVNNSLGKMYLEMYPNSEIKHRYKIANAPTELVREPKPLHKIKLIDPATGSGNFVLYGFSFFYALYLDQIENYGADYDGDDIPQLIIENNLHGIDLDDRAVQLAQLGLWIKARQKRRSIGKLKFNLVSSDFFLPDFEFVYPIFKEGIKDTNQLKIVREIWADLQQAHKFGSLVKIEEKLSIRLHGIVEQSGYTLFGQQEVEEYERFKTTFFKNLEDAVTRFASQQGNSFLTDKTQDAITYLKLITQKYDVATANPPYIDSRDYGDILRLFLDENYRRPKSYYKNLFASFIKRTSELINSNGKFAIIHPRTFMFISSFEDSRNLILEDFHINIFVDYGLSNLFGNVMVDPCFYTVENKSAKMNDSIFIGVDEYTRTPLEKNKKQFVLKAFEDALAQIPNKHLHYLSQNDLKLIDSHPYIFWISNSFRTQFGLKSVSNSFDICNGISSGGNNEQFYRFWWEVEFKDILKFSDKKREDYKWTFINKGGEFNKWAGNLWLVFEWENNGAKLKGLKRKFPSIRYSSEVNYFKEGLAFSGSSTKGLSVRHQPPNCIFERSGKSIFALEKEASIWYLLCLLNSKLATYIIDSLNPTVSFQSGDVDRIPYVTPTKFQLQIVENLVKENVDIKNFQFKNIVYEPTYSISPFLEFDNNLFKDRIKKYLLRTIWVEGKVLINEAILNEKIFEIFELSANDKVMVLTKEGESIGALPVSSETRKAYLENEIAEFPLDNIREYIQNLPEKECTSAEREAIENEFPQLYQSNNDLEEFCIRHQVNPINVWYWFKQSNVIPKQRMNDLAMEFLADMLREILMEDDDGIISLVPNVGEKVLLDRIEEKFMEKGFTMAQYSSFDSVLGRELNDYINNQFFKAFSDHLNLFMYLPKTPFIWHLTSGPEQGFDCYIIIYKWSRDKLMRIRSVYIENRERALVNRQTDLRNKALLSAAEQNEADKIYKQLKEIESFKKKIDELLEEGYNPILDDGVGKNIAPLQKKGMLPYEVLNDGQLKKYLNADW